jgi:Transposase DDE domain
VTLSSLAENLSTSITRAGIHERFNKHTCDFFKAVYSHLFEMVKDRNKSMPIHIFKKFQSIQIIDSSSWNIPDALRAFFAGAVKAGCKTQFMIDYMTGKISHFDLLPQVHPDQQYAKGVATLLKPNDLCIFDLGYAIAVALKDIAQKGAFFICRFNASAMHFYLGNDTPIADLVSLLRRLSSTQVSYEIPCFVGTELQRTKVRMMAIRVPEEIANRRREKLRTHSIKQGSCPSEKNLYLCDWTLLITNIPQEKGITINDVITLYSIRWTIELFFKQLKSILHIHKTHVRRNHHRFESEIWARCIVALFITYCYSIARTYTWCQAECEISFEKTVKYFKRNMAVLLDKFLYSLKSGIAYIERMIFNVIQSCRKYRQHTRKNSLDKLIERTAYKNLKCIKLTQARILEIMA